MQVQVSILFEGVLHHLKKIVFIGDSYGQGYTPDGNVTSWITNVANGLPISTSQKISSAYGGAGFGRTDDTYKFSRLLNNLSADNSVKYVVICGGYNDIYSTASNITSGMSDCKSIIASKFPNATMCVGFIGNTTDASKATDITTTRSRYQTSASSLNAVYLENLNVLTSANLFSSEGETRISNAIVTAMNEQLL